MYLILLKYLNVWWWEEQIGRKKRVVYTLLVNSFCFLSFYTFYTYKLNLHNENEQKHYKDIAENTKNVLMNLLFYSLTIQYIKVIKIIEDIL